MFVPCLLNVCLDILYIPVVFQILSEKSCLLFWQYGRTPIEIVALSGRREDVEILFPVTSRLSNVRDWSVDGVIGHVISAPPAKVCYRTLPYLFILIVGVCMLGMRFP
jgi:hypothetical protein